MIHAGKKNKFLLCIIALAMIVCTFFTMAQPIIAQRKRISTPTRGGGKQKSQIFAENSGK